MLAMLYSWTLISGMHSSLMGALWPVMYLDFSVALSAVGIFSWLGSATGFLSNLGSGWLLRKFGAYRTTLVCAFATALVVAGYALSNQFWILCFLSIPSSIVGCLISVSLNDYVAKNYASRHMSWIHCMWGFGSILGTNFVSFCLRRGYGWHTCYFVTAAAWLIWAVALLLCRRRWKDSRPTSPSVEKPKSLPIKALIRMRGVKEALLSFFCYNSLEQGVMMWISSYLVLHSGLAEGMAATYTSLFFLGITVGRMLNGFLTVRFNDDQLIRFGQALVATGVIIMLLPFSLICTLVGLLLIGVGCAPVCPCLLHATPARFGTEQAQSMVGLQVAASTLGGCVFPSAFGLAANYISISLLPAYILICLGVMALAHYRLVKLTAGHAAV